MKNEGYERVFNQLKPALIRMAQDEVFREAFETNPLKELRGLQISVPDDLADEMEGKTFSEFWSAHRTKSEERVHIRDLPPVLLSETELDSVVAGARTTTETTSSKTFSDEEMIARFAPPYVPVGPSDSTKLKG